MRINFALRFARYLTLASVGLILLAAGCSRSWYREQADPEAAELVAEKTLAANSPFEADPFSILPGADSRLYDPTDPDRPPLK
jgi:hypothetical protein